MIYELITVILHDRTGIDNWHHMSMFGMGWLVFIGVVYLIILLLLAIWTYQDDNHQEVNSLIWGLIVLLSGGLGFLLYIIIRQPRSNVKKKYYPAQRQTNEFENSQNYKIYCKNCGTLLPSDSNFCSECGFDFGINSS